MDGHTIHRCRVHHDRHRSLADGCQEGSEELLPQQRRCDIGWCAVLSRPGRAIAQIVLQRYGHVLLVYMLRVVTLETDGLHASHLCVHVAVLTEVLVDAGPAGVTSQVYRRTEGPGHADGTCLVCRSLCALSGYLAVEGSAHVDVLWEQRTPLRVCRAVILVQSEDAGNTDVLHRRFLDVADDLLPLLCRRCAGVRRVQHRSYLVFPEQRVSLRLVNVEYPLCVVRSEEVRHQLHHLSDLLFQCQLFQRLGGLHRAYCQD